MVPIRLLMGGGRTQILDISCVLGCDPFPEIRPKHGLARFLLPVLEVILLSFLLQEFTLSVRVSGEP